MANRVRISTVSPKPPAGNPGVGQEAVDRMIDFWTGKFAQVLPERPDLIVVPECCVRFDEQTREQMHEFCRFRGTQLRDFFASVAKDNHCYVTYSDVHELPDGSRRNAVQMLGRNGELVGHYNKKHLVVEENTRDGTLCGADATIIECDFGRVGCAICFDLNFEPLRKRYMELKPDLLLFSSRYHGGLMQAYWAYCCRAHFVAAIAGPPSAMISPVGVELATTTNYYDYITATINLDCRVAHIDYNEDKFKAMKNKYGPEVTIFDPGFLGSVLITSESDARTAVNLIEEFEIELLDDYMVRALAFHADPANVEPT